MAYSPKLMLGDCLDSMKELYNNSVDAIVVDPPYGLKFMGKKWDYNVPSVEIWKEVLRVLKPGGHLLSFGGTRTYHRMVVNIEDAGFEIRDQIQWLYGSGFPKSHNISKGIDKKFGAKRKVVGKTKRPDGSNARKVVAGFGSNKNEIYGNGTCPDSSDITAPSTDQAKQWDGFGTALKPANEPIVLARKPLSEKTIVDNVLRWGTGGLNIDGCKIENEHKKERITNQNKTIYGGNALLKSKTTQTTSRDGNPQGRFPANLILGHNPDCELLGEKKVKGDKRGFKHAGGHQNEGNWVGGKVAYKKGEGVENGNDNPYGTETVADWKCTEGCAVKMLDEQSGILNYATKPNKKIKNDTSMFNLGGADNSDAVLYGKHNKGGASRFFYCAKASKRERNAGLEGMEEKPGGLLDQRPSGDFHTRLGDGPTKPKANHHPTVKPLKLMEYLCRLITPPNGTVLDPFMGSGTTGIACKSLGFGFIGIEKNKKYFEIAKKRIQKAKK